MPSGATATVPDAPIDLAATPGDGSAHLNWTPPASDGGSPITGFNVYEGDSVTPLNADPITDTSFDVTGLDNGTTYVFTVKAVNAIGEGAASNEASPTPERTGPADVPGPVT